MRDNGIRVSCRLAIEPNFRELHMLEAVEDVLRAQMDLRRQLEQGLGAAIDGVRGGPWHHQEDGLRLEDAGAGNGCFQILREGRALQVRRR